MRKRILTIGGLLLLALFLVLATDAFLKDHQVAGAKKTANQFITYVSEGDVHKSYQLLTADAQVNDQENGSWQVLVHKLTVIFTGQKATYVAGKLSGDRVQLTYNITGNDNLSYHLLLTLVQQHGWHVDVFSSGQND